VQHGKSLPKDIDPEQGLSQEGIAEVQRIAQVAKGYNIGIRQIRHSTKDRARRTAALFHEALTPEEPMQVMEGLGPLDDVKAIAGRILDEPDLMLVGHLPFMERLASYLITGSTEKKFLNFRMEALSVWTGNRNRMSGSLNGHWYRSSNEGEVLHPGAAVGLPAGCSPRNHHKRHCAPGLFQFFGLNRENF
jgi:phosphohistidine phosphatase